MYYALGCETYPNGGYDLITNYVSVEVKVLNHNKEYIRDLRGLLKISILPTQMAEFTGANKGITNYFNEHVINKIPKKNRDHFFKAVLNFSIDEEGRTKDIYLSESSSKAHIDKIILKATAKMPTWKPAKNEKGNKVKQIYKIPFGGNNRGC